VLRVREELPDGGLLRLAPGIHDHDPVGEIRDDAEIVGDQDDRGSEPRAQLPEQIEDAGLDRDVERRCRLVGDQDLGVAGKRHRDHHALAHTARELVGVLVDATARVGDVNEVEQLDDAFLCLASRETQVLAQHLLDLVPDPEHRVQRGHRLLEDERNLAAADLPELRARRAEQLLAVELDAARDRRGLREQPQDRERGHAFPAAGLADDPQHLTLGELERHPVDRVNGPFVAVEADREVPDLEQRFRH
jgi:hypothetical protein